MVTTYFRSALAAILFSMLLYGFFPVAFAGIQAAGVLTGPFLISIHVFGFALIGALFLVFHRPLGLTFADLARPFGTWQRAACLFAGMAFNTLSELCLFTAVATDRRIQASVLYELWPVVFLILTAFLRRQDEGGVKFLHDKLSSVLLFSIGAAGLVFVSISSVALTDFRDLFLTEVSTLFGVLAALSMGFSAFFTTTSIRSLRNEFDDERAGEIANTSLAAALLNLVWFRLVSIGLAAAYAALLPGGADPSAVVSALGEPTVLYCGLVVGLGGMLFHVANARAVNSNINLLWYLVPVVATGGFVVTGTGHTIDDNLFLGTLLIVAANFGLNMGLDFSPSFRAMLITTCLASILVNKWAGLPSAFYFESLGVMSSIFAIVAAFVANRAYDRRGLLRDAAARLYFKGKHLSDPDLETFAQRVVDDDMPPDVADGIVGRYISKDPEATSDLIAVLRQRQSQVTFGELFSVWLLGLGSVAIAIVGRPSDADSLSFLPVILATAIVFLCVNLSEVGRTRILERPLENAEASDGISGEDDIFIKYDVAVGIAFVSVLLGLSFLTSLFA
ncbi:MAG: hypothetical protein AAGM21_11930 [Pseudomonadota bacterium]